MALEAEDSIRSCGANFENDYKDLNEIGRRKPSVAIAGLETVCDQSDEGIRIFLKAVFLVLNLTAPWSKIHHIWCMAFVAKLRCVA